MKILNFGSCNVDYVYYLDHIVNPGETETSDKLEVFPGGKGLNQSIAVSRAGVYVYHAGCIGKDGEMLEEVLKNSGVDVSLISHTDGKNGHAVIQVAASGENSIFLYPGSNEKMTEKYIDSVLYEFFEGDIILLQNEINKIDYIIDSAYNKKMCIVFNPSPFNEKIQNLNLNKISILILNEVEGYQITGEKDTEEIIKWFKKNYPDMKIMLTLGSKGCVYSDSEQRIRQNTFEVTPVDTTAAGDTFTGYFIAGISRKDKIERILQTAYAAAAISVTRKGAAPSIPTFDEVAEIIPTLKESASNNKKDKLFHIISQYVSDNIKTANVSDLADILGYSSNYTGILVKQIMGESFLDYLQNIRFEKASEMLKETDMPISDIINEAGYENESFFRKKFREKYGINPLEYRKKG